MAKWKQDVVASLLILTFLTAMFIEGIDLNPNSRTYPFALLSLAAIFSLILLVKGIYDRNRVGSTTSSKLEFEITEENKEEFTPEEKKTIIKNTITNIVICCIIIIVYIFTIRFLGYLLSTVLFILCTLIYLRIRKWWLLLLVSGGIAYFIFFMFNNLLLIPLPSGLLFS